MVNDTLVISKKIYPIIEKALSTNTNKFKANIKKFFQDN